MSFLVEATPMRFRVLLNSLEAAAYPLKPMEGLAIQQSGEFPLLMGRSSLEFILQHGAQVLITSDKGHQLPQTICIFVPCVLVFCPLLFVEHLPKKLTLVR
jgi:hypothetical protein